MRVKLNTIVLAAFGLTLLVGGAALSSGCNTTEGVGKDTESVGKAISNTASDAKN